MGKKQVFFSGQILPEFISESIAKHATKKDIGGHSIFLGQVRADNIDGKLVTAIEYTAHEEMAEKILFNIREETFAKYNLTCMHIYHSLGKICAGEICLFVFTSSKHRQQAIEACSYLVERIKKEVPIWGKEILEDEGFVWKVNSD